MNHVQSVSTLSTAMADFLVVTAKVAAWFKQILNDFARILKSLIF